jgi:hypothetical protein
MHTRRRSAIADDRRGATGYEPGVINSPASGSLQGDYFASLYRPWALSDAGTEQVQVAMEKYARFTKSDFPTFGQYEAWAGANLMIKGLELAGPSPTHGTVIKDPGNLKSPTACCRPRSGLPPSSGSTPLSSAFWVMQAEKNGFAAASTKPFWARHPGVPRRLPPRSKNRE